MNKFIFILAIFSNYLLASGFSIPEQGARAIGLGNAFSAVADDPSALFYNPAGINQLKGDINLGIGTSFIIPENRYENASYKVRTKEFIAVIPSLNVVYKVFDKLSLGFSFNTPFGSKIEWPDLWAGSSLIERMNLQLMDFSFTVSYSIFKNFNFALSYDLGIAEVDLQRRIPLSSKDYMTINMGTYEKSLAHGFKASLLYRLNKLRLSLVYKYGKSFDFKGNADFDVSNDAFLGSKPEDQKMSLTLNLPMEIIGGVSYEFIPKVLLLSFDLQYVMWSSYKELRFKFEKMSESVDEKNWEDIIALRMGMEFNFQPRFSLRLGYTYDFNPIPSENLDPILPDSNRHVMNFGLGYTISDNARIDFAYTFLVFTQRESENKKLLGTYNGKINILSLSTSFRF